MMLKAFVPLAILLSSTAAATGIGPEIAYVKAGTTSEIVLVEPDGTRLRSLYRSKQRMRIFTLDMKPGGGELAFEEVGSTASTATLKVLRYDDVGTLLQTKSIAVCRVSSIDYRPSGTELIYNDSCAGARRLDTATMTSSPLDTTPMNKVSWRDDNTLVYNRSTAAASEVFVAPVSAPATRTLVGVVRLAESMDVSTSGSLMLVDPVDYGSISLFDMTSGTEQKDWQIGHFARFSPDDFQVVYATGWDVRGQYIMIRKLDGSGTPFRLAGKAAFGPIDWRN